MVVILRVILGVILCRGRRTAGIPWYVPKDEGISAFSGISCAVGAVMGSSRGTVHAHPP